MYQCKNPECAHKYFVEEYKNKVYKPEVRKEVIKMAVNCTETRATGRILGISKDTVTAILKQQKEVLWQVNYNYINEHRNEGIEVVVISSEQIEVNEAEIDEMWSFIMINPTRFGCGGRLIMPQILHWRLRWNTGA